MIQQTLTHASGYEFLTPDSNFPEEPFLLTAELLKSKLSKIRRRFERQKAGLVHVPSYTVQGRDFPNWVDAKIKDLLSLVAALTGQLPVIQNSWGPLGQPGNIQEIKATVDEFIRLCDQLVDWEDGLRAGLPPEDWRKLKDTMKGWTEVILREMERLPTELLRPFENGARPTGEISIMLKIDPPSFDEFNAAFEELKKQDPRDLLG